MTATATATFPSLFGTVDEPDWRKLDDAPQYERSEPKTTGQDESARAMYLRWGTLDHSDEVWASLRAALLPSGFEVASSLLRKLGRATRCEADIDPTSDGGVTITLDSDDGSRELTFILPSDGSRRFFVAREPDRSFRMTGLLELDLAVKNLARWLDGQSNLDSTVGLSLPNRGDQT